jgi:hypothetical protein
LSSELIWQTTKNQSLGTDPPGLSPLFWVGKTVVAALFITFAQAKIVNRKSKSKKMFTYRHEDFFDFAYVLALGRAKTADYITWADALLVAGCEAPSVAALASCIWEHDPEPQEVQMLFHGCVAELGLELLAGPDDDEEVFIKAISIPVCRMILTGAIAPEAGLAKLLDICEDSDDPALLWTWVDMANELSPGEENPVSYHVNLNLAVPDECIRAASAQFISLCALDLPTRFPLLWQCRECGAVSDENTYAQESARTCPECKIPLASRNMRFFINRAQLVSGKFRA